MLAFEAFSNNFLLNLNTNKELLPENYFEEYEENGVKVTRYPMKENNGQHCYYQGLLQNTSDSWVAVSICEGVSGVIFDGRQLYYIEPDRISDSGAHFVFKASDLKPQNKHCGTNPHENFSAGSSNVFQNYETLVNSQIQIPKSDDEPLYVELIYVVDTSEDAHVRTERKRAVDKCKELANIVNGMYAPLNIVIALVGVVVWSRDEITLVSNGDVVLTNFLKYRKDVLYPVHPHDSAQLVTVTEFEGGVIGKALLKQMCHREYTGGVIVDHDPNIGLVAATSAHELGHTFGMEHDSDTCQCSYEYGCIMKPSSSSHPITQWSSCSIQNLDDWYKEGHFFCLKNKPTTNELYGCGNRILDPGEECDCGPKEFCNNPCCDADTCRLTRNSACASGKCCDLRTCQIKQRNFMCREAASECDIPEYCDGSSGSCPADRFSRNGNECGGGKAYCYNGRCDSHEDQCKSLWGSDATVANLMCFDVNINGTENANCGYDKRTKSYIPCNTQDVRCGLLKCESKKSTPIFGEESSKWLKLHYVWEDKVRVWLPCRSVMFDFGNDLPDPGMAPNGAKCGDRMLCVNQRCIPTSHVSDGLSCCCC